VSQISAHTNLCQEVMKLFRDRKLEPQADVEQVRTECEHAWL